MTRVRETADQMIRSFRETSRTYKVTFVNGTVRTIRKDLLRGYKKLEPGARIVNCSDGCKRGGRDSFCHRPNTNDSSLVECHRQFLRVIKRGVLPHHNREKFNKTLKCEKFRIEHVDVLSTKRNPKWRVVFYGGNEMTISRSDIIQWRKTTREMVKPGQYLFPCNMECDGTKKRCPKHAPDCLGKYFRCVNELKTYQKVGIARS